MPICAEISSQKISPSSLCRSSDRRLAIPAPPTLLSTLSAVSVAPIPREKLALTCVIGQTSFLRSNSIFTQPRRSCDSIFPQFLRHRYASGDAVGEFQLNYTFASFLVAASSHVDRNRKKKEKKKKKDSTWTTIAECRTGDEVFVISL